MRKTEWIPVMEGAPRDTFSVKKVSPVVAALSAVHWEPSAVRQSIQVTYQLGGVWKGNFEFQGRQYSTVFLPGAAVTSNEGLPEVPQEGIFIPAPKGIDAGSVEVRLVEEPALEEIPWNLLLKPVPSPITEEEYIEGKENYAPGSEYHSSEEYPGKFFELLQVRTLQGKPVIHLMIYPVQYRPKLSVLRLVRTMTIEISYDVAPGIAAREFPGLDVPVLRRPDKVSDYVIVAPPVLAEAVQPLIEARSGSPHYAMVANTEDIINEFPGYGPEEDKFKNSIRDFLSYAKQNWRVKPRFAVLAGDVDLIPVHLQPFTECDSMTGQEVIKTYPSDHFYADLTDNLAPDIIVSRIPISDPAKMQLVCASLAKYPEYCGSDKKWRKRVALIAENRMPSGTHVYEYERCLDYVASKIQARFECRKLYEDVSTRDEVIGIMETGVLVANYRGHGAQTMWISNNGLRNQDINNLTNSDKPPLVFCICCSNAQIDDQRQDCFVETFLTEGKCVAIVGASRPSPTYANNSFNEYLWQAIIEGETTAGGIFQRAKALMVERHPDSKAHTQNVFMYMLFGDPAAQVIDPVSSNN